MDSIKKNLIQKSFENKLAHFYMLTPSGPCSDEVLNNWVIDLIKEIRMNYGDSKTEQQITNHIDLLHLNPKAKNYHLDDLSELFQFLTYKATQFNRKYIIIHQAEALTGHTSNKLLKTLEEPQIEVCIFLLNNKKQKLLDTINSRAINLPIKIETKEPEIEEKESLNTLKELNIHDFISTLKKKPEIEQSLQFEILKSLERSSPPLELMAKIDSYFNEFQTDQLFNNTPLARFHKLHDISNMLQ